MPKYYNHIQGWCDYENLYQDLLLNKLHDNSTFIEVGVWKGKSLCYIAELAKELNKNITIFGVDIFANELDKQTEPYKIIKNQLNGYTEFLSNMAHSQVLDRIIPLALFSEDAAKLFSPNSVDCVFLDAAHDKENVINDLNSWIPTIKAGGYLCGHDYIDGIQPFVDEYFQEKLDTKVETYLPHCFIWKKDREL